VHRETNHNIADTRLLELLEQWERGDFTRSDEAELYRLAAGDDFRREVVEGFLSDPQAAHQMAVHRLRLRLRAKQKSTSPMWYYRYIAAAAVALLLLGIWRFVSIGVKETASPMAVKQSPALQDDRISTQTEPQSVAAAPPPAPAEPLIAQPTTSDRARVVAPIYTADSHAIAATTPAPTDAVAPSIPPPTPSAEALQEDKMADMALSDQTSDKKEQEVSAASRDEERRKAIPQAKRAPTAAKPQPDVNENVENFSVFVRKRARLPAAARDNNISGYVRLRVYLNEQARVHNVEVLSSLGYGCDEEAIRLALQFTGWKTGQADSVVVDIPFVR
jgi:outer membrane biosynthesis protein TonB